MKADLHLRLIEMIAPALTASLDGAGLDVCDVDYFFRVKLSGGAVTGEGLPCLHGQGISSY
jgi:hypothetical protein